MPGGRPSLYKPEYCEQVIEHGKQGLSEVEIACAMDITRTTMRSWADQHPEFSSALTRAKEFEQAWFEKVGREALFADKFNAPVWKKSVEARFRDDYTERKEVENKGALEIVMLPQDAKL